MLPESCWNIKLWAFLLLVDSREAERVRKAGCRRCDGGVLHVAKYGRKPRGVPVSFLAGADGLVRRHSFCCGSCRRRTTPASVRFFGHRVYVGLLFVLLPALLGDGSPSAALSSCRRLHLSVRTLRRWRRWWQEEFSASRFWRANRSRLVPGEAEGLPGALVAGFRGAGCVERAVRALLFLREWFLFLIVADGVSAGEFGAQKLPSI